MDSQEKEHWYSDNEARDGIAVLTSDSKESVIFFVEQPSPSVQGLGIIVRASQALPTFSTSSSFGKFLKSSMLALSLLYKTCNL